jgi:hypothetical protein
MNNQLILRTLTSPFPSPYSDITRGSVLSQEDVDNNFIYIKGQSFYSATSESGIVTLLRLNGNDFSFSIPPSTGNTDTYVTGGTPDNSNKLYTFTNNFGNSFNVNALTDITVTGGTYTAGTATFKNNTGGTFTVTGFSNGSINKYVETVFLTGNTTHTITHGLGLDISVDVKDLTANARVNVVIDNYQPNTVDITTNTNIVSARIIIIG